MCKEEVKIYPLKEKPEYLNQIAEWLYQEWGVKTEGSSLPNVKQRLQAFKNADKIPINYVACIGKKLVGTFNIMKSDPPARKDLSPWLASLYVDPTCRNQGIGTLLIKHSVSVAKHLGNSKLYLCTPNQQELYTKLGWEPIDEVKFRGENVTIMKINT